MRPLLLLFPIALLAANQPQLVTFPQAPVQVRANQLTDAAGRPFLLRGTAMPFKTASDEAVLTPSVFSQISQRWNMNTLRLQLSVTLDSTDPTYLERVRNVVHAANSVQLLVMLAPHDEAETIGAATPRMVAFWTRWATAFRDEPLVLFDLYSEPKATYIPGYTAGKHTPQDWRFWLHGGTAITGAASPGMQALANAVRAAGATQPVVAMVLDENPLLSGFDSSDLLTDPNTVYEICPLHADNKTDAERDAHFGALAMQIPLLANNWDLQLDKNNAECNSIPTDLTAVENLIKADLDYFDSRDISWTSSFFTPGKLVKDNVEFFPTQLNASWTCGQPASPSPGMGETVRYHLWGASDASAIAVNGAAGGLAIAPGSVAVVYGKPVLMKEGAPMPWLFLTDSAGQSRIAPIFYAAPSSINFTVPPDVKPGLVQVSVVNEGGPNLVGSMVVQPVAPGLFSLTGNGRGPVIGFQNGKSVQLIGTGFRRADHVSVTIAGKPVPVISFGIYDPEVGTDQVIIQIPDEMAGGGLADLIMTASNQVANAVQIRIP